MKNARLLLVLLPLLGACAEQQLAVGGYKKGIVVEAEGYGATRAQADAAVQRAAVAGLFDLFLTSAVLQSDDGQALEKRILARAGEFVPRSKTVSALDSAGQVRVKARAMVSYERLGHELDALGLIRPEGVAGAPRLLVSLEGPAAAEEGLRRVLLERGYVVVDEPGAKIRAGAAVSGRSRAFAADDPRLPAFHPRRAEIRLKAQGVPDGEALADFVQEATALDADPAAAEAKALSDAGELAGERLRQALSSRYRERVEMSVLFAGFGDLAKARKLLADLRADPRIAGAAFDSIGGGDLKLRVFVERRSADELAADLSRLKGYSFSVRFVEADYHYVELEGGGNAL